MVPLRELRGINVDDETQAKLVLSQPIVVLRGLIPTDVEAFSPRELKKSYGSREFRVVLQERLENLTGWQLRPQRSEPWTLGAYVAEMEAEMACKKKRRRRLCFGANVDTDGMREQLDALKAMLPSYLHWQGKHDVLRFCKQTVSGMTAPQLYLKLAGNWTGGHEENLRFSSVNCNHGPGTSRWYAVEARYAARLRTVVLSHGVDIYRSEGNWWPLDVRRLVDSGIMVQTGLQRPGDVVVLRGSTIHWVVAETASVHSSWNLGVLDARQILEALDRAALNDRKMTAVFSILPVRSLVCDIAREHLGATPGAPTLVLAKNGELAKLKTSRKRSVIDPDVLDVLASSLADTLQQEAVYLQDLPSDALVSEPPGALVMRCDCCSLELPLFYVRCDQCRAADLEHAYLCAVCAQSHLRRCESTVAIAKTPLSELRRLLVRADRIRSVLMRTTPSTPASAGRCNNYNKLLATVRAARVVADPRRQDASPSTPPPYGTNECHDVLSLRASLKAGALSRFN